MNEQHVLSSTDLLRSLRLIRSDDPADRQRGIEGLSKLVDDPRVLQVFEHLYENDSDPGVRNAAWRAISRTGPSIPAPGPSPAARQAANTTRDRPAPVPKPADRPVERAAPPPPPPPPAALFLLEQSNARLVARHMRRQKSGGGRVIAALAGLLLLSIGVLGGLVLPDWVTWYRLRQGGIAVQGEIVEVRAHGDKCSVLYRFRVAEGDPYTGEQPIEAGARDRLAEMTPVQVVYLPDDPAVSRLEGEANPADARRDRLTIGLALLVVGLVVLVVLAGVRRGVHPRRKCVIRGQIVSCSGYHDDDGDYNLKLRYRFRSPSGQTITGQVSQIRNDLAGADLPEPGTPVAVYYRSARSHLLL